MDCRAWTHTSGNVDSSLVEDLNTFYAHFEASITSVNTVSSASTEVSASATEAGDLIGEDCPLSVSERDMKRVLRWVNSRKAAGPDGVSGWLLALVFTSIFNLILAISYIPICFKMFTIIPVPKETNLLKWLLPSRTGLYSDEILWKTQTSSPHLWLAHLTPFRWTITPKGVLMTPSPPSIPPSPTWTSARGIMFACCSSISIPPQTGQQALGPGVVLLTQLLCPELPDWQTTGGEDWKPPAPKPLTLVPP